ncbi:MAG TPA: hypothetical protein VK502_03030 [Candidatus Saccharimonadales bacterium]|nr:hypothetical protein [Candidatus Saccharimonadales bacterium]
MLERHINARTADEIVAKKYDTDYTSELSSGQVINKMAGLAVAGQKRMTERHGSVLPNSRPGRIAHLGYNNGDHTRIFAHRSNVLGRSMGHSALQIATHEVVAAWHDMDQTSVIKGAPRMGLDEKSSAEMLIDEMRKKHIPKEIADLAAYGILGTWPVMNKAGVLVGQWASVLDDYPSKEAEMEALVAGTCDLGDLYSSRSPFDSSNLYRQREGYTPDQVPRPDNYIKHLTGQVGFLENHKYPIAQAEESFKRLQPEVASYAEKKLERVKKRLKGGVDKQEWAGIWKGVISTDLSFMRDPKKNPPLDF